MATATGGRSYALELAITAPDRAASSTLKGLSALIGGIGTAAAGALAPVTTLGSKLVQSLTQAQAQARELVSSLLNPTAALAGTLNPLLSIFDAITARLEAIQKVVKDVQKNSQFTAVFTAAMKAADQALEDLEGDLTGLLIASTRLSSGLLAGVIPAFSQIGQVGSSVAAQLGLNFSQIGPKLGAALNQVDVIIGSVLQKVKRIPQEIADTTGGIANVLGQVAGFNEAIEVFGTVRSAVGSVTGKVFALTQEIGFFMAGLQALQQLASAGPFDLLIQQNVKLQEQLLSTKASLASTNTIIQDGTTVGDPTKAIQALEGPVKAAIARIRQGSLELVGVTSSDLVPVFQVIAQQSSQIGINLEQSADLALSAAAALGTIGLPLNQARQEITSLVTGTIDMNSVLAKSLGITNQMVGTWRNQGKVFEELTKRLEAYRAGNALAAQTINGVFSNIQEIVEEIGRLAGEELLAPIVAQLNVLYEYFKANKDELVAYITDLTATLAEGVQAAVDAIGEIFNATAPILSQIPKYLIETLRDVLVEAANTIRSLLPVIQPILAVFGELAKSAHSLVGPVLKVFLTLKTVELSTRVLSSGFGTLANLLPGVGELLFFLSGRNNSLVRTFVGLRGEIGFGAAGFLLLGKNIQSIPGAMALLTGQISKFIPIFGPAIAGLTPAFSGVLLKIVGLTKAYPVLGEAIKGALTNLPDLAKQYEPVVEKVLPGLGGQLTKATEKLSEFTGKTKLIEETNNRFKSLLTMVGEFGRAKFLGFTLLIAGAYVAIQAFDRFILKNEEVKEALSGIFEGLLATISGVFEGIGTAVKAVIDVIGGFITAMQAFIGFTSKATTTAKDFGTTINDFLLNPFVLATGAVIGLVVASEKLAMLGGALKAFQLLSMATGAVQASIGFKALKIALLEGTGASAVFMAKSGTNVITLGLLKTQVWGNVVAMRAFIFEKVRAAIVMAKGFIAACVRAIVSLRTLRLSTLKAAFSFVFMGGSATGVSNALTLVALKARMASILTALSSAVAASSAGFFTLATAAWTAVSGLVAVLAPVALLVAGLAVIGLVAYAAMLNDSTEATKRYGEQTALLSGESLKLGQQLKNATTDQEERVKNGIRLTDEEYQSNQRLQAQTKQQIQALDEKIAVLKKAQESQKGQGNKNALEAQFKELERQKQLLEALSGNIQIQAKDLPRLGTAYEQFAQEVNTALKALERPSGDPEIFKKQAQTMLEGTEAQLKAGLISAEQATRRYAMLANNTALDKETQLKAQQAITEAGKIEGNRQTENVQAKQETVTALQEAGRLSEAEGERQLTVLKGQELDIRLAALKTAKAEEDKIRAGDLSKQLTQIDQQIADAQKAVAAAAGDPAAIKQVNDQQVTSLKEGRETVLAQITQTEEQVNVLLQEASAKKGTASDEANNKAVDLQRNVDGLKRDLSKIDGDLKTAEETAAIPVTAGPKDEKASKDAQESLTKLQQDRQQLQAQFESASAESSRTFDNQQSKIDADRQKNDAKQLKQNYGQELRAQDEAQQILEGSYAKGLIGEQDFNDESLAITKARLDVELAEVERQRALLAATDKDGLHKLEAQEQQLNKRRVEAQEKYQQQQVERLERAQRKALDVSKQAEAERNLVIQKFLSSNLLDRNLSEAKAEEERAKSKQVSLEAEFKEAKEFEAKLERLPKFNNAVKEEERQGKIRAAKVQTTQINAQLLENQRQAEEAHTKFLVKEIEKREKAEENVINVQIKVQDLLIKALERKNKILETAKELQSAVSGYVDGEYKLAERLAINENKKRKIQEAAARARLAFLDKEIKYERLGVELENQKNKALIEREKMQNKLEKSRAKGEVAKVNADPKATPEEKEAAIQRVAAADYDALIIDQQGKDEEKSGKLRLQNVDLKGELKRDGARADLAEITRTTRDDRALAKEFLNKAQKVPISKASDPELDPSAKDELPSYEDFLQGYREQGRGTSPVASPVQPIGKDTPAKPVTQQPLGNSGKAAQGAAQQSSRPSLTPPPVPTLPRNAISAAAASGVQNSALFGVVNDIFKLLNQSLNQKNQEAGATNLYNTFNQYFTKGDVQSGSLARSVEQTTLNTLFAVGQTAKQQRGRLKPT